VLPSLAQTSSYATVFQVLHYQAAQNSTVSRDNKKISFRMGGFQCNFINCDSLGLCALSPLQ